VDRQQFVRLVGATIAAPWLDLVAPLEPTPVPRRVGRADIDQIQAVTEAFRSLDNTHGGLVGRDAVFAQLHWSAQLLHADCPTRLRPHLFAAVSRLAGVAGYMAFDGYAHDDARRAFHFGLQCAEHADHWQLRAHLLNQLARQATWCGQPFDALVHVDRALLRPDRLTPVERASLYTQKARALARLGRTEDTLASVGTADEQLATADRREAPAWMAFYDHAQHHSDTGQALYDLALAGKRTNAAHRLAYAVAHHGTPYARLPCQTGQPAHGHSRPAQRRHHRTSGTRTGREPHLPPRG
jgi:hypothetical protein